MLNSRKPRPDLLFDLGGVLIDWDPRYFYRTLFREEAAMEAFLANVCTSEWNRGMDAGRPMAEAVAERQALHPEFAKEILCWRTHWGEMLKGAIPGSVALLGELRAQGANLYSLTNWSAETFPEALARFEFLAWFKKIIVSGEVGLAKPDPAIFRLALDRCGLLPETTLFIDDVPQNVEAALALGLDAIRFRSPEELRRELKARGY